MTAFEWQDSPLRLSFAAEDDGPVRLVGIGVANETPSGEPPRQPLVEILAPAFGRTNNSYRYDGTAVGLGLRFSTHTSSISSDGTARLEIVQGHAETGLVVTSVFEVARGCRAARTWTTVELEEEAPPLLLWAVTTFATGALVSESPNEIDIWHADSSWCAENRWAAQPLRSRGLVETDPTGWGETSRSRISFSSLSSWSSGQYNPVGAVQNRSTKATLAWQIEHNGAWHAEVGESPQWGRGTVPIEDRVRAAEPAGPPRGDRSADGAYLALLGPTDTLHQWSITVSPGRPFTTVPAAFTHGRSLDEALGNLTAHRRTTRRPHPQNETLPIVFNDYMNTLEGDPTEAKLRPLIDAASTVGAEYFCIDAGWYDDTAGWWASVGDWRPSTARFESGLASITEHIRDEGMTPGLWLEPEVVGVTSSAASTLPDAAFLQRGGVRLREHSRYFLDLRHPAARAHLDEAVDRLVEDFGIGYFKLDYNVTPGAGTDLDTESVGGGLLEHNRALVAWLASVLDRHPDLVLENCGSGAMRSDFAMLGQLQLQSTSDQQDPLLYPAIAVGSLAHVLPEQAAHWAYPQPDMDDEQIVFTMCTGLAGRLYQAGVLSGMDEHRLGLVAAGVAAHKATRRTIARSTPRFPTGLPTWDDGWVSVVFDAGDESLLLVWRQAHAALDLAVPMPAAATSVEQVYPPVGTGTEWAVTSAPDGLDIRVPQSTASARMYRIRTA